MPTPLTAYTILNGKSDTELMEQVNRHIREGWRPIGGISIVPGNPSLFFQAMIR